MSTAARCGPSERQQEAVMEILAHRGVWQVRPEQNTHAALAAALDAGDGIETDLRDRDGEIVISHDMAGPDALLLRDLVALAAQGGGSLALNVKADGLAAACGALVAPIVDRCFFFDMATPDMQSWLLLGLPVFTRHSDVETHPVFYAEAAGVWMDEMLGPWITADDIARHLDRGKRVGIISGELYGRHPERLWEIARSLRSPEVMICTDLPDACRRFRDAMPAGC